MTWGRVPYRQPTTQSCTCSGEAHDNTCSPTGCAHLHTVSAGRRGLPGARTPSPRHGPLMAQRTDELKVSDWLGKAPEASTGHLGEGSLPLGLRTARRLAVGKGPPAWARGARCLCQEHTEGGARLFSLHWGTVQTVLSRAVQPAYLPAGSCP